MSTIAYVGLDVSQDDASVCFLLADGAEPLPRWSIPNTAPGADSLAATLKELAHTHQEELLPELSVPDLFDLWSDRAVWRPFRRDQRRRTGGIHHRRPGPAVARGSGG